MSELSTIDTYGTLIEPATLRIQRLLPGPVERVWSYLTESELRRKWLASGTMEMEVDSPVELVWRNDELTDPPGKRPETMPSQHSMQCRITEVDPPNRIGFTFGTASHVLFTLEPRGKEVLMTVIHSRVPDRSVLLNVSAGWHAHLDVLEARIRGVDPKHPHWDHWTRLKAEYDRRLPA